MQQILIAIDYNPSAEKVAEAGYELAKAMNAKVTIVHVIADAAYYAVEYSPIMGYHGAYTEGIVAMYNDIKKRLRGFWQLPLSTWAILQLKQKHLLEI